MASDGVEILYKDWSKDQPVVVSHEWPLSADDWNAQTLVFPGKGWHEIAHHRRGHGRSLSLFSANLAHPAGVAGKDAA